MPELPEVEVVVRRLRPEVTGATITKVEVFHARSNYPQETGNLAQTVGKRIEAVERRGKNIIIRLSGGLAFRIHLRMTGMLRAVPDARLHTPKTRVLVTLKGGNGIAFEDSRILGTFHLYTNEELEEKLRKLGVEPLTRSFTVESLIESARRSTRAIKVFLMDQSVVAGLGNIYAAESLFRARIHPSTPANKVSQAKLQSLHTVIPLVLRQSIKAALKSFTRPDRHEGMSFDVYGRKNKPCHVCGKPVKTMEQDSRTTYFCSTCQRK